MKKIFIALFLLVMASTGVVAQSSAYSLVVNYNMGELTLEDLILVEGQSSIPYVGVVVYTAKIVSFDGEILHETEFSFSISPEGTPLLEWFDDEGNQIIIPTEPVEIADETSFRLVLPYFVNAERIEIYSPENMLLLTIPVARYALCNEDFNCEAPRENYDNCPSDCPSGSQDGICDFVPDGICDPDCSDKELDCQDVFYNTEEFKDIKLSYDGQIAVLEETLESTTDEFERENIKDQIGLLEDRKSDISSDSKVNIFLIVFWIIVIVFILGYFSFWLFRKYHKKGRGNKYDPFKKLGLRVPKPSD